MTRNLFHRSSYEFHLPQELIAQYPPQNRDEGRMMVVHRKTRAIEHRLFREFPEFVQAGDVVVLNDSRVVHARLELKKEKTGGKVNVLVLDISGKKLKGFLERGKKVHTGLSLIHEKTGLKFHVTETNKRFITLESPRTLTMEDMDALGEIPLPPYIKRKPEQIDEEFYQTVFAREKGSIAAPTAGLHFTESILERIKNRGAHIAYVTLHVSLGTFLPIHEEDIRNHNLYPEVCRVSDETAQKINLAKASGRRIFAVGTTVVRTLESFARGSRVVPGEKFTHLYITPGFQFQIVDALLTNFHLPGSSLIVLVCAFGGYELIMKAYREAVKKKYRFYSYGDCMLIL